MGCSDDADLRASGGGDEAGVVHGCWPALLFKQRRSQSNSPRVRAEIPQRQFLSLLPCISLIAFLCSMLDGTSVETFTP